MSTRPLHLDVTQDDLDCSDDESDACPTSRAFRRAGYVVVRCGGWFLFRSGQWWLPVRIPTVVQEYLTRFDGGGFVQPATLTVEVPT